MEKGETMNVNGENDGNDNPWSELEKLSGEWGKFNNVPSGGAWGRPAGEGSPNLTSDEVKDAYETETETDGEYDDEEDETPREPKMSFEEWLRIRRQNSTKALEESDEALKQRETEEVARKVAEEEERKAERERKELEEIAQEMGEKREELERKRKQEDNEFLKRQRIQEVVERDLSEKLLKIDSLDEQVYAGNPEIEKHQYKDDPEVTVYDLKGIPFKILSTTIDYRKEGKKADSEKGIVGDIGTKTYKEVMEDPSIWTMRRDEAERMEGFGTREANARGDTISASYWNSERNIGSHVHGDLIYGFEGVDADSIILVANGDGGTNNMAGNLRTSLQDADEVKRLEGATGAATYNEVLLRRYSENGIPKRPDYLIVEDGKITEDVLRHAKYYDIPIINVENSFYQEKARKRGEELMDSISESDSYEELSGKLEELLSIPMYQRDYNMLKYIGREGDEDQFLHSTPLRERLSEISKMEMMKRLDYLKNAIESATRKLEENTKNGVRVSRDQLFPDLKGISVGFGRNNELMILGGLKDRSLSMDTWIFGEEGDYYSTLEPVVRRFLEADQENWKAVGQ